MANKVIQMKDKYKSTNKEFPYIIGDCFTDDADKHVEKIIEDNIIANPTPAGGETTLVYLEIGGIVYALPVPTDVIANPTLAGGEAELGSIQIGETKYKIGGGKQLYQHTINIANYGGAVDHYQGNIIIINDNPTPFTNTTLNTWLFDNDFKSYYANNQEVLNGLYGNINFGTVKNSNDGKYYTAVGILCRDLSALGGSKVLAVAYIERDNPTSSRTYSNLYMNNSTNTSYKDNVTAL